MKRKNRVITESEGWDLKYEEYKRAYNKKAEKYAMKRMWDRERFIEVYKKARKVSKSPLAEVIKENQMMTFSRAKNLYKERYGEEFKGFGYGNDAKFRGIATLSFVSQDEEIIRWLESKGDVEYEIASREKMRNMNAYYYVKYMVDLSETPEDKKKARKEALENIGY